MKPKTKDEKEDKIEEKKKFLSLKILLFLFLTVFCVYHFLIMGKSLIHLAAEWGNLSLVRLMVKMGDDVNKETWIAKWVPLHFAAKNLNPGVVEYLISQGAEVNKKTGINEETPLHFAALSGDTKSIKILLKNGADPNMLERDNFYSPLNFAILSRNPEAVKLLVENSAQIIPEREEARDPLETAKQLENKEIYEYLKTRTGK